MRSVTLRPSQIGAHGKCSVTCVRRVPSVDTVRTHGTNSLASEMSLFYGQHGLVAGHVGQPTRQKCWRGPSVGYRTKGFLTSLLASVRARDGNSTEGYTGRRAANHSEVSYRKIFITRIAATEKGEDVNRYVSAKITAVAIQEVSSKAHKLIALSANFRFIALPAATGR